MLKPILAFFFLTIFTATIIAPTVILMVDDSLDVSMFYNITEEEEKKESEQKGKKELINSDYIKPDLKFAFCINVLEDRYSINNYVSPYIHLILPPPEFHI